MIDLTKQVAAQPSDQPRNSTVRFVKLKPSQRPGLANSALSSTFAPVPGNSGRLSRPLTRPLKTSAPTWRADQSSSGDSSDESSEDSDDDEDSHRRKKHDMRDGVRAKRRPATTRNMLQV